MTDQNKTIVHLTDSDRFVANWLVDRITSLTDEQHEKLNERLAMKEEKSQLSFSGFLFRKIKA